MLDLAEIYSEHAGMPTTMRQVKRKYEGWAKDNGLRLG